MKIVLTEQQYKLLIELNINNLNFDIINNDDYGNPKWFNYHGKHSNYFKVNPTELESSIKYTINYLNKNYKTNKILIKDNGETVAFMLFTKNTLKKEGIDTNDDNLYDLILSTAIHPDYRRKGLLNLMIKKTNLIKPFLIHTSDITTPGVWEKFGCKPIKDLGQGNQLQFCK